MSKSKTFTTLNIEGSVGCLLIAIMAIHYFWVSLLIFILAGYLFIKIKDHPVIENEIIDFGKSGHANRTSTNLENPFNALDQKQYPMSKVKEISMQSGRFNTIHGFAVVVFELTDPSIEIDVQHFGLINYYRLKTFPDSSSQVGVSF